MITIVELLSVVVLLFVVPFTLCEAKTGRGKGHSRQSVKAEEVGEGEGGDERKPLKRKDARAPLMPGKKIRKKAVQVKNETGGFQPSSSLFSSSRGDGPSTSRGVTTTSANEPQPPVLAQPQPAAAASLNDKLLYEMQRLTSYINGEVRVGEGERDELESLKRKYTRALLMHGSPTGSPSRQKVAVEVQNENDIGMIARELQAHFDQLPGSSTRLTRFMLHFLETATTFRHFCPDMRDDDPMIYGNWICFVSPSETTAKQVLAAIKDGIDGTHLFHTDPKGVWCELQTETNQSALTLVANGLKLEDGTEVHFSFHRMEHQRFVSSVKDRKCVIKGIAVGIRAKFIQLLRMLSYVTSVVTEREVVKVELKSADHCNSLGRWLHGCDLFGSRVSVETVNPAEVVRIALEKRKEKEGEVARG